MTSVSTPVHRWALPNWRAWGASAPPAPWCSHHAGRRTRSVIDRQLDLFELQWKAAPDFVDGHQHVQQFAGIRQALVQALISRYAGQGKQLPYLRISRAPSGTVDVKSQLIAAMGANTLARTAQEAGIAASVALSGIYDFAGNQMRYGRLMSSWLQRAPEHSIIMCHPAQAAEPGDSIGLARAQEFAYLSAVSYTHLRAHETGRNL